MSYGVVPPNTSVVDGSANLSIGRFARKAHSSDDEESPHASEEAELLPDARLQSTLEDTAPLPAFKYQSLDYEVVENAVYRADQALHNHVDSIAYTTTKWTICFFVGVLTAAAAFLVNMSVEIIAGFKFDWTHRILARSRETSEGALGTAAFLLYLSINCALVLGSSLLTVFYGPAAAGSGIADVKAYLNGIDVPGIFLLRTLVVKVIGSIGSVAGGLAIGKEGPFVHAGAAVAAILSQGEILGLSRVLPVFKRFWNDRDRHDMVACGAAAGVAAAFRSPLGGVLFALEEMTSWWRNQLLWMIFFTTAVVSTAVRVMMNSCSTEGCSFFGKGSSIHVYEIKEGQDKFEVYEMLPMLLLGVIGGLLGSGFILISAHCFEMRKKYLSKYGPWGRVLESLAIAALTSTISFIVPMMASCKSCAEDNDLCHQVTSQMESTTANFNTFNCHKGQYNDLATMFFNTPDDAIRDLFSPKTPHEYTVPSLLIFTTCFYFLAAISYGAAVPTGLFVPSILCGAAYGRLVGIFVTQLHQGNNHIDEGTYALLGAASFLGGAMRLTVCTCVMLLELTNNLALLPLIMLVLLVAKAVGDGTGVKAIYENQMDLKCYPYLQPLPDRFMRHVSVHECCGRPPVKLQRVEKVSHIVRILRNCGHNCFVVMNSSSDGDISILGTVLRRQLLVLLKTRRAFQPSPYVSEVSNRVAFTYHTGDFHKPISKDEITLDDIDIPQDCMASYIDLSPYVNPAPYVVQENTSMSKVYTLFRTLGLRHIVVVPRAHDVVGMISRRDVMPEVIEHEVGSNFVAYAPASHNKSSKEHIILSSFEESPQKMSRRNKSPNAMVMGSPAPATTLNGDRDWR